MTKQKKLIIGLAAIAVLAGTFLFKPQLTQKEIAARVKEKAVKSLVFVRGLSHAGSGVVIKSDKFGSLILTNKHICEPHKLSKDVKERLGGMPSYIQLITYNKRVAIAQPVKVSVNTDLCLLHTTQTNLTPVKIANAPVRLAESLHTCGNPYAIREMCYSGSASNYSYFFFMLYRVTSVPARPGQSGSGVFNNDAELVGLISLGSMDGSFSAMVPLAHIKLFLAGIEL